MLEIHYCEDILFDLPPPTLFYRASKDGFEKLVTVLEKMINNLTEVCLNDFDFVEIAGTNKTIKFRPFSNQITLKITDNELITDISIEDWNIVKENIKELLNAVNSLTYFVEFDNYYEDGNIAFES